MCASTPCRGHQAQLGFQEMRMCVKYVSHRLVSSQLAGNSSVCADNIPGGKKWCGDCELPKSTSLASSSALFPSKALSSARDVRQHSMSGSSSPTGLSRDANVCQVCLASFGVFSTRRKFFCHRCRATVCNSCSKRVASATQAKARSGFDGLMDRLKEASDARLCLNCDTSSPMSRASSVASV
ncbi:zinc finger protein, putative [Bodo saltans]|uniref:Zinc finger protein, putative n=1 Tax=Bodo saltans TaxID=75058 RepID=A0A0S4JPC8_BODSA|nr:zinc finger protein, putative [Bodo saltans]|eukprot:CUG92004.1 zinc finger protein, putative [Bodo saltans]